MLLGKIDLRGSHITGVKGHSQVWISCLFVVGIDCIPAKLEFLKSVPSGRVRFGTRNDPGHWYSERMRSDTQVRRGLTVSFDDDSENYAYAWRLRVLLGWCSWDG